MVLALQYHTCEEPRPQAWSMCASCFRPCISQSRATPQGRSRYQMEFPSTLEFPTELPTHSTALVPDSRDGVPVEALQRGQGPNPRKALCGSFSS